MAEYHGDLERSKVISEEISKRSNRLGLKLPLKNVSGEKKNDRQEGGMTTGGGEREENLERS